MNVDTRQSSTAAAVARAMTTHDLGAVLAIEAEAHSHPWSRGNFVDSLAAGYWAELLVDGSGQPLAYAVAMPGVDEIHLLNLTTAPAVQGQGHAQALLLRLLARCQASAAAALWLEVRAGNARARRLYERAGFSQQGLRRGYYAGSNGQREDAVVMMRRVNLGGDHGLD